MSEKCLVDGVGSAPFRPLPAHTHTHTHRLELMTRTFYITFTLPT